jgi:hypothetical protein
MEGDVESKGHTLRIQSYAKAVYARPHEKARRGIQHLMEQKLDTRGAPNPAIALAPAGVSRMQDVKHSSLDSGSFLASGLLAR